MVDAETTTDRQATVDAEVSTERRAMVDASVDASYPTIRIPP